MKLSTESLLQPSLSAARPAESIYSAQATFFTAFFGGGFAALLIGGLNSRHLGRLRKDTPVLAALALVYLAALAALVAWSAQNGGMGRRESRYAVRLLGLAVWGALFLGHRPAHRAAELSEVGNRPAWKAGIGCVVAAAVLQFGYVFLLVHGFGAR